MKKFLRICFAFILFFVGNNVFAVNLLTKEKTLSPNLVGGPAPECHCENGEKYCSDKYDLSKDYIILDSENEKVSNHICIGSDGSGSGSTSEGNGILYINNIKFNIISLKNSINGIIYIDKNALKSNISEYVKFNQNIEKISYNYIPNDNDSEYIMPGDKLNIMDGDEVVKTFTFDYEIEATSISIVSDKNVIDFRNDSDELQLNYVLSPSNNSYSGVIDWTSSNPDVASVYDGRVSINGRGETTITAKLNNGVSDSFTLTIIDPRVNGVSVEENIYKDIGDSDFPLNLKVDCDDNPDYSIYYSNSQLDNYSKTFSSDIIDINENGMVHINGSGSVYVGVKVYDKYYKESFYTSFIITVTAKLKTINIPDELVLNLNTDSLKYIPVDFNPSNTTSSKNITLISSNSEIVDVNNSKQSIIPKKRGKAIVTAITDDGISDSCIVTVEEPKILSVDVDSIITKNIDDDLFVIKPDIKLQDMDDCKVEFVTEGEDVKNVDYKLYGSGINKLAIVSIKDIGKSKLFINVYYPNSVQPTFKKEVEVNIVSRIKEFNILDNNVFLKTGDSHSINYEILPTNTTDSKEIKWTSLNEDIAIVDHDNIIAKSAGNTIISGTINGITHSLKVTVINKVNKLLLSETDLSMEVNETKNLTVDYEPNENIDNSVVWSSSNKNVATVDDNGNIKSIKPGKTVITVTSVDGVTATCNVVVNRITMNYLTFKPLANKVYTGKQIKQDINVYYNGYRLRNNIDYKLVQGKNINIGVIKVDFIGDYIGSKYLYFYIVPKKIPIKTPKSTRAKTATVYYTNVKGASGYQIAYKVKGTNKWYYVWSSGSKKTITKLKSKKYYSFAVRGYKNYSGKKYYGVFSNIKTIKIK